MLSSKFLHIYRTKQWEKWLQCTLNKCFLCEYFVKPWPYTESKFVENVKIFYLTFVWDSILDTLGKRLGIETHIYTQHEKPIKMLIKHILTIFVYENSNRISLLLPFHSTNTHTFVQHVVCPFQILSDTKVEMKKREILRKQL